MPPKTIPRVEPKAPAAPDPRLLENLRPSLLRFFERRVGSRADVEDLTQEVFVHLARSVSPDDLREPERYVFRVATNVLHDRLRRGVVRRNRDHVPLEDPDIAGELPSAERVYQAHEVLERVMQVLAELT